MKFFKQPGHVLPEGLHGLEAFFVVFHFPGSSTNADIPIAGPGDDHLVDQEEIVQGAESVHGTRAPNRHNSRSHLALQHIPVGAGYNRGAFEESFHVGGNIGDISRRPQEDPFSPLYFGEVFIDPIGIYGASQVFVLWALVAGNTAGDGYSGKLDQLGFDSFACQFFQHSI